jgi:polar amino acid transport system substrate-binding protein
MKLLCMLFSAALSLVVPISSTAGCSSPVEVVFSSTNREMEIDASTGQYSGAAYKFLMLVEKRSGCAFHFQTVPRTRAWLMLEGGYADLIPTAIRTPQRDSQAIFIDQLVRGRVALLTLKGQQQGIRTSASLIASSLRISVVRGFDYGPEYMKLITNLETKSRLNIDSDTDTMARKLAFGRIDGVMLRPSAFAEAARKAGITDQIEVHLLDDLPPVSAGLYLSPKRLLKKDVTTLMDAMTAVSQDQEYIEMYKQTYQDTPWALTGVSWAAP